MYVSWPNLVKIIRWEVDEMSSGLAEKNSYIHPIPHFAPPG